MKKYSLLLFITLANIIYAQVSIGKESPAESAILDFQENTNKGIILPWISENPAAETGSLIYDVKDKKVKYYNGTNWMDLSINEGIIDTIETDNLTELDGGIIIGTGESNRKGVLVLESDDKALVLPKNKSPWENIYNPEAGTIVYDTTQKLICIFNGKEWTFWGN